jgi:basic membrane lipoprotein Med (substrate-binding protein (PBP1-ABC) superfamily)
VVVNLLVHYALKLSVWVNYKMVREEENNELRDEDVLYDVIFVVNFKMAKNLSQISNKNPKTCYCPLFGTYKNLRDERVE